MSKQESTDDKLKQMIDPDVSVERRIVDDEEIEKLFSKHNIVADEGYKNYLKNFGNDYMKDEYIYIPKYALNSYGTKFSIGCLFGMYEGCNNLEQMIDNVPDEFQSTHIPIGDLSGGDYICMDKTTGEIYFWLHEENYDEELKLVDDNFNSFIDHFVFEEVKQIDTSGITMNISDELKELLDQEVKKYN